MVLRESKRRADGRQNRFQMPPEKMSRLSRTIVIDEREHNEKTAYYYTIYPTQGTHIHIYR